VALQDTQLARRDLEDELAIDGWEPFFKVCRTRRGHSVALDMLQAPEGWREHSKVTASDSWVCSSFRCAAGLW